MGYLGSFGVALLAFVLLMPVRGETSIYDCLPSSRCPGTVTDCYTLLGWKNALGPLGCSPWAAFGVAVSVGLAARLIGALRERSRVSN